MKKIKKEKKERKITAGKKYAIPIKIVKNPPLAKIKLDSINILWTESALVDQEIAAMEKKNSGVKSVALTSEKKRLSFLPRASYFESKILNLTTEQRANLLWLAVGSVSIILVVLWIINFNYLTRRVNPKESGQYVNLENDLKNSYQEMESLISALPQNLKSENNLLQNDLQKQAMDNAQKQQISEISQKLIEKINEKKEN